MNIIVVRQGGELAIAKPWSFWSFIGLDRQDYCIKRVELFDANTLLSAVELKSDFCVKTPLPLRLTSVVKFSNRKHRGLVIGRRYGIGIDGIGTGRVDFVLHRDGTISNERDWQRQMKAPCGSFFGSCLGGNQL